MKAVDTESLLSVVGGAWVRGWLLKLTCPASLLLSRFSGVAAVGCQGGHTYLVDLRLSDEGPHRSSLAHPAPLCILDPRGAGGQSLAMVAEAVESGAHICIELSGK